MIQILYALNEIYNKHYCLFVAQALLSMLYLFCSILLQTMCLIHILKMVSLLMVSLYRETKVPLINIFSIFRFENTYFCLISIKLLEPLKCKTITVFHFRPLSDAVFSPFCLWMKIVCKGESQKFSWIVLKDLTTGYKPHH